MNYMSEKCLVYRINEGDLQINNQKTRNPI